MTIPTHVSAWIQREGRVLLVQEGDPQDEKRWNLPGGHLEKGETIRGAAAREAREETGLHVTPVGLLGVYSDIRMTQDPPRHTLGWYWYAAWMGEKLHRARIFWRCAGCCWKRSTGCQTTCFTILACCAGLLGTRGMGQFTRCRCCGNPIPKRISGSRRCAKITHPGMSSDFGCNSLAFFSVNDCKVIR